MWRPRTQLAVKEHIQLLQARHQSAHRCLAALCLCLRARGRCAARDTAPAGEPRQQDRADVCAPDLAQRAQQRAAEELVARLVEAARKQVAVLVQREQNAVKVPAGAARGAGRADVRCAEWRRAATDAAF